jgi:DNA-directed RNA polymerase beta' subunit
MKFKIFIVSVFYILISNVSVFSQEGEYTDLLVYYVDEEYEKCLKKADKYMNKDESKYDPLPYLYTSMTYYEMSRDSKYTEDYPKAFRNCLSYLTKYRRKDKTYTYKSDAEPFIEKIKLVLAEEIENYKLDGTARSDKKITGLLKKLVRIDPDDAGIELMLGVYYAKTKNRSESKKYIASGKQKVMEIGDSIAFGDLTRTQQLYFKESIIAFYQLKKDTSPDEAEKILLSGEDYFVKAREDCYIENKDNFLKVYKDIEG